MAQSCLMPNYSRYEVTMSRGEGAYLWDAGGRRYLDFLSGVAVCSVGHCHPDVVEAIKRQAGQLIHVSNYFYTAPQNELAGELCRLTGLGGTFFCNSGAEAVETAIKLARRHWWNKARGGPARVQIVSARGSFHGRTMGALAATGQEKYHEGFGPLPQGFTFTEFNNPDALRAAVGCDTCALMLECVQGEGGVHVASAEYLSCAQEVCRATGALLVIDEIQTGFGRTGAMFSYQRYGLEPDIVTVAKALGGGVAIGAVVAKPEVAGSLGPGTHGSTFGGNPLACAAALATLKVIERDGLPARAAKSGEYLVQRLRELASRMPRALGVPRGLGLMVGIPTTVSAKAIARACLELGLLVNAVGEDVVRLLPPLVVTREQLDEGMSVMEQACSMAAASRQAPAAATLAAGAG